MTESGRDFQGLLAHSLQGISSGNPLATVQHGRRFIIIRALHLLNTLITGDAGHTVQQDAAGLCMMLLALQQHALAQDFSSPGPFATASLSQKVTITPSTSDTNGNPVNLDVIVTYPASNGTAPFPVVAMFNGFQTKAPWYGATANHVASWGYVVLQYTVKGLFRIVTDREELCYLQPLLNWLQDQGTATTGLLRGLPDTSRLATMGHSRGGKLAALHYAIRNDVTTAVLIDPIDNTKAAPEGPDYPSAVKALKAAYRTAGLIGAGITGKCNPIGANYPGFFRVLAPGSWQMVILQAGHMQFARTGNAVLDWGMDKLCRRGRIAAEAVIRDASTFAAAWLESTFRREESQEHLEAFEEWIQLQIGQRVIEFTINTSDAT